MTDKIDDNISLRPLSADLDGDAYSGVDRITQQLLQQMSNSAAEDYRLLLSLNTFKDKLEFIEEHAGYNRSKFARMSKRRKKIFVKGFNCYDIRSGILVHQSRHNEMFIMPAPIIMKFTEKVGVPMSRMLDAWVGYLAD